MTTPAIMRLQLGNTYALVTSPTGASHIDKDQPCQDACMVTQHFYRGQPYMVLAVADGHGSDKYTRSEIGAHLAMEAAHQAAADLAMTLVELQKSDASNWYQSPNEDVSSRFQRSITKYWNERIIAHAMEKPEDGIEAESNESKKRYGTTLVVAMVFKDLYIFASLGDSSIYTVQSNKDGISSVVERLPSKKGLDLGTDSLVSDHAVYLWRTEYLPHELRTESHNLTLKMIFLTSDGLTDSLTDVKKSILSIYEQSRSHGIDWLQGVLPDQLAKWSKDGVGDDMGVVLLFPNFSQTQPAKES